MSKREIEDAARLEAFRAAAQRGIDAMDRGDFTSFDDDASLEAYLDTVAERAIQRRIQI